jgi:hypothetical protein
MNTTRNHEISLENAIEMTTRYRADRPANFPICESFEKEAILGLLNTTGCEAFRIYYGMKENNEVDAILVAVDATGQDILPLAEAATGSVDDPVILEDGYRCPDDCPPPSPLNG